MKRTKISGFILLMIVCLISNVRTQSLEPVYPEDPPIKVNTTLLNIPVIVSDRQGHNISGLTKKDFIVTKSGQKQEVDFFANQEEPMKVAIILDTSLSAVPVIGRITKAAREFLTVLGPDDQCMVVSFDDKVVIEQAFTSDKKKLRSAFGEIYAADHGGSIMNDAVYRVVTKDFSSIPGRKAIIVLTDGDVWGKVSAEKLRDELIESDVLVYPIFYYTRRLFPTAVKSISYEDLFNTKPGGYLNSLAAATGGRLYAADGNDFAGAFQNVANELKKQYVLGIQVDSTEESKNIKIKVDREGAVVRAKGIIRPKKLIPGLAKN